MDFGVSVTFHFRVLLCVLWYDQNLGMSGICLARYSHGQTLGAQVWNSASSTHSLGRASKRLSRHDLTHGTVRVAELALKWEAGELAGSKLIKGCRRRAPVQMVRLDWEKGRIRHELVRVEMV